MVEPGDINPALPRTRLPDPSLEGADHPEKKRSPATPSGCHALRRRLSYASGKTNSRSNSFCMVATHRVTAILADARTVRSETLRLLGSGDIRGVAEKAWCTTKCATDAFILARTGEEPETSSDNHTGAREAGHERPRSPSYAQTLSL